MNVKLLVALVLLILLAFFSKCSKKEGHRPEAVKVTREKGKAILPVETVPGTVCQFSREPDPVIDEKSELVASVVKSFSISGKLATQHVILKDKTEVTFTYGVCDSIVELNMSFNEIAPREFADVQAQLTSPLFTKLGKALLRTHFTKRLPDSLKLVNGTEYPLNAESSILLKGTDLSFRHSSK